jgi:SAM-dependent methyltransferase
MTRVQDITLWAPKIYTSTGFVRGNIVATLRALDLGCGDRKLPGAIGVDSLALPSVDVVHDLSVFPWPFETGSVDLVFANHFLEHATDIVKTLAEIHRIMAPQGRVVIQVPYFRSVDAVTDPTHKHFFTARSLDYFIQGTSLAGYAYAPFLFTKLGFWYGWPQKSRNPLKQLFKNFIQSHSTYYDQYLSLLMPVECLTWELEKAE